MFEALLRLFRPRPEEPEPIELGPYRTGEAAPKPTHLPVYPRHGQRWVDPSGRTFTLVAYSWKPEGWQGLYENRAIDWVNLNYCTFVSQPEP